VRRGQPALRLAVVPGHAEEDDTGNKQQKRLGEDHENARALAEGIANIDGIAIDVEKVVTNIVIFDITATGKTSAEIVAALKENSILAVGFGDLIRMVTHCDVSRESVDKTVSLLNSILHG